MNKEYPLYSSAARILSLHKKRNILIFTSPVYLAIAFYFSSKKSGYVAKKNIEILYWNINITTINEKLCRQAIQNARVNNFEDGLEYYSALHESCNFIATENQEDFYFSEIPVVTVRIFFLSIYEVYLIVYKLNKKNSIFVLDLN